MSAILVILSTLLSLSVPFVQPINHAFAESNPQKADTFYWDNEQGFRITDQTTKTDFIGTDGGPKHAYAAGEEFTCEFTPGTDINGAALPEFFGRRVGGSSTTNIQVKPYLIDVQDWQQPYYNSKDIYLYNISTKSNNGLTPSCVLNKLGSINVTKAPDDITPFTYESSYLIKGQNEFKDQSYNIVGPKTDKNTLDYDRLKFLNAPYDEKSNNTVYYKNGSNDCANYIAVNVKSPGSGTLYQQARNPQSNNDCQLGATQTINVPCSGSGGSAGAICAPQESTVFVSKEPQKVTISRTSNFKSAEAKKPPNSALAANIKPPDDTKKEESGCSQALTPFGWILCPITSIADDVVNWFQGIVQDILYINPTIFTIGNPLYNSWRIFSNLASALIVLIALAMIAGQIFNFEIFSAYTVKKVLPRLIIGAILIQLSWFLTTTLVELVNAIGTGLYWLLLAPFKYTGNTSGNFIEFNQVISYGGDLPGDAKQVFGNAGGLAIGVVAGGTLLYGSWMMLILAAIGVIISLIVALITLMVRAMLIILLIVIAPVAIAAWILPGTQKFWDMWWKMFSKLLMMFPLIMLLFAGGVMAGTVLAAASKTSDGLSVIMNFAVVVAYFAPIFMISMTYKFAGGAFASMAALGNKLGKQAQGGIGKGFNPLSERLKANKQLKAEDRKTRALQDLHAGNNSLRNRWRAGTFGVPLRRSTREAYGRRDDKAQLQGLLSLHEDENLNNKLIDSEAANYRSGWGTAGELVDRPGYSSRDFLVQRATTGTVSERRAAMQEVIKRGDVSAWGQIQQHSASLAPGSAEAVEYNRQRSSGEFAGAFMQKRSDWIKTPAGAFGSFGGEGFALSDSSTYAEMNTYLNGLRTSNPAQYRQTVERLGTSLDEAITNPQLRAQSVKNADGLAAARGILERHFDNVESEAGHGAVSRISSNGTFI